MDLILIRHPRTVAASGVCYGALDLEPDADCLAADAARLKAVIPPDARIVCSPQQRALSLAQQLGEPEMDARLVEMDFGDWENRRWDDLPRTEIDAWAADMLGYVPPGGESVKAMSERVLDWWESVQKDGTLVAVGHGGPWRLLAAHLMGVPHAHSTRFEVEWGGRAHWRITSERVQLRGWNLF